MSITLLQAAFSHNGLSGHFDGEHAGAFREILSESRASGPIVITHTRNDPYGGMGRNGAQHTNEVDGSTRTLTAVGPLDKFASRKAYNLRADEFIKEHSDVKGNEVAFALLNAVAAVA